MTKTNPDSDQDAPRRTKRKGSAPASPAGRLARVLSGEMPSGLSCASVQAELPIYVEAELRAGRAGQRYPHIAEHLLICEECSALHALLLDCELAPALAPLPVSSMAGLRRQLAFASWQDFVTRVTETILQTLVPAARQSLADAAGIFFDQVRELTGELGWEPAVAFAMGQGGDLSLPVRFLIATFLATQWLAQDAPADRIEALRTTGELDALARRTALRAASDLGLRRPEAVRFATEYARLVAAPEVRLPTWPPGE